MATTLLAVFHLEAFSSFCSPFGYLVVYINGIDTLPTDATVDATMVLAPAIGSNYEGEDVRVVIAYNPTKGVMSDLVDVFRQKITEYPEVKSDLLLKALTTAIVGPLMPKPLVDFISQYHIDKIKNFGFVGYSNAEIQEMLLVIRNNSFENQKILLVGHSQGGLCANTLFATLTTGDDKVSATAIQTMQIASPAAYVAGNGRYVTSANDLVISGLRLTGLTMLPMNVRISLTIEDVLGHSMSKVYMNPDLEGRAEVVRNIYGAFSAMASPGGKAQKGPITVGLSWPRVWEPLFSDSRILSLYFDLHVVEPTGSHVYPVYDFYKMPKGDVGYLDYWVNLTVDTNTHYTTICDKLLSGDYKVGVTLRHMSKYYHPDIHFATAIINTPYQAASYYVDLQELHEGVNDVPSCGVFECPYIQREIAIVRVTLNEFKQYKFQILDPIASTSSAH
jgi:hypothetical protein